MIPRTKEILIWSYRLLFVAACSALGYCAIVALEAMHYQAWAREKLKESNSAVLDLSAPSIRRGSSPGATSAQSDGVTFVGRVDVPRIHLSAMISEGATAAVLSLAVGHVLGTALPGRTGNTALAAHRDTFFRRLGELQPGDVIQIWGPRNEYSYRVVFTDIVDPDETWVLQPASGETLTLITCYPFRFVGSAPKRFVVRARRSGRN